MSKVPTAVSKLKRTMMRSNSRSISLGRTAVWCAINLPGVEHHYQDFETGVINLQSGSITENRHGFFLGNRVVFLRACSGIVSTLEG